jgi:uncharacterized UPF0160 family protein
MSFRNLFQKSKIICTHDGKFHADDIYSVATLSLYFNHNIEIIRSREQNDIDRADIVVDNGREYSVEKQIFDHHQPGGAGKREYNNVPYAGFGLIWKHFGLELCKKLIASDLKNAHDLKNDKSNDLENISQRVWQSIDENFVSQIDASDTGFLDFYSNELEQSIFVSDKFADIFFPTWRESYEKDSYNNFELLVQASEKILKRVIKYNLDREIASEKVLTIYNNSKDKRVIYLDQGYPWRKILAEKSEPLLVVFPEVNTDRYMIQAIPLKKDGYEKRINLLPEWAGLSGPELEEKSGIKGFVFCHNALFLGVVNDLETAEKVVNQVLNQNI